MTAGPRIDRIDATHAVVVFEGDLTSSTVNYLRPVVRALVEDGARDITIDLEYTDFVDSSGLGMLLGIHLSLVKVQGRMQVVRASQDVIDLLRTLRLDDHFPVSGRDED